VDPIFPSIVPARIVLFKLSPEAIRSWQSIAINPHDSTKSTRTYF
jgi:hypothetical protein